MTGALSRLLSGFESAHLKVEAAGGVVFTCRTGMRALAGFVGAGLMFAGARGTCRMARMLSAAAWNRTAGV